MEITKRPMNILVTSLEGAIRFEPEEPTYAIRIFNSACGRTMDFDGIKEAIRYNREFPLKESSFYKNVETYVFDDVVFEDDSCLVNLDRVLAERMLLDFLHGRGDSSLLMVHCFKGRNRSPAVAMAFNEIFGLGINKIELVKKYPNFRQSVYDVLVEEGRRIFG